MLWAQIAFLVLYGVTLLIAANRHGRIESKRENFWENVVGCGISFALLWAAGGLDRIF